MLQYVNTFIDTVQDAKTQIVKTFVKDETLSKSIQSFVDSQRAFTKQVAKTTFEVATETAKQAAKFDASKVFAVKK
jgi:uncharacterized protein YoxC